VQVKQSFVSGHALKGMPLKCENVIGFSRCGCGRTQWLKPVRVWRFGGIAEAMP
jgi:hypothetical protein